MKFDLITKVKDKNMFEDCVPSCLPPCGPQDCTPYAESCYPGESCHPGNGCTPEE